MGQQYTVEMAFDWDTVIESGQSNRLLENTLQFMGANQGQAQSYAKLQVGDSLLFPIYDNSSQTRTVGTIKSFQVDIIDASTGNAAQPFTPASNPSFSGTLAMSGTMTSATYGPGLHWAKPVGSNYLTLTRAGRYLVTMTLTVQKGAETRTFSVDPEWIVGEGG